ncbi:PD-(D/E)XK motif protein [Hyphomonas sp.]|uniref:PD-(D/E)XK motif protein n=1 Tax=Hyphomonas sp. TaxID=87 RepID=UPI0032D97C6A
MNDHWDQIHPPAAGYTWKLRNSSSPIRTLLGRHADGHVAFMMEMERDYPDLLRHLPEIQGLNLDHQVFSGSGSYGLLVALREAKDEELFASLCDDLAACIEDLTDERQAVLSLLGRLERWQRFLARDGRRLLSTDSIRGLVAELDIVRYLVAERKRSAIEVVKGWEGPLRAPQDFRLPNQMIEVKSWGGAEGAKVRISSEIQLQVVEHPIYLAAVHLVEDNESTGSRSLNDIVKTTRSILPPEVVGLFEDRLDAARYIELPHYDAPRFRLNATDFFEVAGEFPALVPDRLPPATTDVQYTLDLAQLSAFRIAEIPEPADE